MPEEFSRTTVRKTVKLPSGEKVRIPVISKIAFIDPYQQYQESQHSLDNTEESNRKVHVDTVHPVTVDEDGVPTADPPSVDDTTDLFCERIETWNAVDPYERYQETQLTLDNITGNDQLPPHFFNHEKTHIYRYHKDPNNPDDDNGAWIDSELIDEFSVIDPYQQHQESHYILKNPTNAEFRDGDLSGQASESDPDITIGGEFEGTQENPIRVDPFQNIVNYQSLRGIDVLFQFTLNVTTVSAGPSIMCSPVTTPIPSGAVVIASYDTVLTFTMSAPPVLTTEGAVLTGAPTITPSTSTLAPFLYLGTWMAPVDNVTTAGTADFHLKSGTILGNDPGCYGESTTGLTGIGYWTTPAIATVVSGTIDGTGVTLTVNSVPWVATTIAISGGGASPGINQAYTVVIEFEPP